MEVVSLGGDDNSGSGDGEGGDAEMVKGVMVGVS